MNGATLPVEEERRDVYIGQFFIIFIDSRMSKPRVSFMTAVDELVVQRYDAWRKRYHIASDVSEPSRELSHSMSSLP